MNDSTLRDCITDYCRTKLRDSLRQIEKCLNLLTVDQVWHRPNAVSNSIGVLVIHLTGNVRQWINQTLGGDAFERDRPGEFGQRDAIPTDEILRALRETIDRARAVIDAQSVDQLTAGVSVQGYDVSAVAAIIHVVEHFSLHTGQIIYATKLLINKDLSDYDAQGRRVDGRTSGVP